MANPTHHRHRQPKPISDVFQSTTSNLLSFFNPSRTTPSCPSRVCVPILIPDSPKPLTFDSCQSDRVPPKSAVKSVSTSPSPETKAGFPSSVRISGLNSNLKGGGPAFVGQVFSMCDLSGTGLMAVSTHFDIPFISKRTPEWLKKMFATVTKSERKGPVFRFFMDLGDAVTYVKRLNIPSGVVGACRLDLAYEHFKEKPQLFQFVPNEKQIKAANKLLKTMPHAECKKVDGVPVFGAQNLDIAIATMDGIRWYTPYFFDKSMLDSILEESVDQHFHDLIQTRHMQRRRDVIDDNLAAEVIEEMGDSLGEPPEVQEVMDEMGNPGIPLSVISKAAEMQLLYAVDKVLLGNRWLRKATGIQPKFPYLVDSFEKRSAASFRRASKSITCQANSATQDDSKDLQLSTSEHETKGDIQTNHQLSTSEHETKDDIQTNHRGIIPDLRLPFGNWFNLQGSKHKTENQGSSKECIKQSMQPNPFLPKITMVGISTGDAGQMNKASLKKTMDDLTKELEHVDQENADGSTCSWSYEFKAEDRDPLFVANVGDYYSSVAKTGSARWVRGGNS